MLPTLQATLKASPSPNKSKCWPHFERLSLFPCPLQHNRDLGHGAGAIQGEGTELTSPHSQGRAERQAVPLCWEPCIGVQGLTAPQRHRALSIPVRSESGSVPRLTSSPLSTDRLLEQDLGPHPRPYLHFNKIHRWFTSTWKLEKWRWLNHKSSVGIQAKDKPANRPTKRRHHLKGEIGQKTALPEYCSREMFPESSEERVWPDKFHTHSTVVRCKIKEQTHPDMYSSGSICPMNSYWI